MTPIKFPKQNMTFAEDQLQYLPLPAYRWGGDPHGNVITCWKPTLIERLKILFGSNIYLGMLTFNQPLQPVKLGTTFDEVN